MCLPVVLWVSSVAPHWSQEQHSNLQLTTTGADLNDPGPASVNSRGIDTLIQLQTFTSMFSNDPRIYNAAAYLVCVPILFIWMFVTLRTRPSPAKTWLALAAIAALSPLPLYHRSHDARILLLTIPACALLWAERGAIGWLAVLLNAAGTLSVGEIPSMIRLNLLGKLPPSTPGLWGKIPMAILARPVPLVLLLTAVFYLWVYFRRAFEYENAETDGDKMVMADTKPLESQ